MFYHPVLLRPHHKMQLHTPWLAATLGVKSIKKPLIIECDTSKLCDVLLQFLLSNSIDPTKRFSLRLSSILVHGTVLIWRQQVCFLIHEIDNYIRVQQEGVKRLLAALSETEHQINHTVKKKKTKKRIVETPPSLVGREIDGQQLARDLLEPLILPSLRPEEEIQQARLDEITLREEVPPKLQEPYSEDFGDSGLIEPLLTLPGFAEPSHSRKITVEVDVHAPVLYTEEPGFIPPPVQVEEPEFIPPPVQAEEPVRDTAIIDVPALSKVVAVEDEIQRVEVSVPPDKDEIQAISALTVSSKVDAGEDGFQIVEVPTRLSKGPKKKIKGIAAKLPIKSYKKFVSVNQKLRIFDDEEDYTDIISENTKRPLDFVPMKKFWPEYEEDNILKATRRTETFGASGILELPIEKSSASSLESLTREVPPSEPTYLYMSTPSKRAFPTDRTMVEIMPVAANGLMESPISPRKRRKVVSVREVEGVEQTLKEPEITEATKEPVGVMEEIPVEHPNKDTALEIEREEILSERFDEQRDRFGIKWSSKIMDIVCKSVKITPVDICKQLSKPLTKLNMAIIFASLLALAKKRYVLLHPAANSLELDIVEKRPEDFLCSPRI